MASWRGSGLGTPTRMKVGPVTYRRDLSLGYNMKFEPVTYGGDVSLGHKVDL